MSVIDGVKVKRNKLQFSRLTNLDGHYVREKIESFLQEDGSKGDITTNYSVDTTMCSCRIINLAPLFSKRYNYTILY